MIPPPAHRSIPRVSVPRAALTALAALAGIACRPAHPALDTQRVDADSIVLERSVCYGFCPAYRLTLHPDGAVHFVTTARRDTVQRADTVAPRSVRWLLGEAHRSGFFALPRDVVEDTTLCPARATDNPTAAVTIFRGDSTHTVIDYHGCYMNHALAIAPALRPLRRFEAAIDSIAGSKRWLDLARPR